MIDLSEYETKTPDLHPLPDNVEVFDRPQAAVYATGKFLIFSALVNSGEPNVAHPERRHGFVGIDQLIVSDTNPVFYTVVAGTVNQDPIFIRQIKMPTNPLEVEFTLQSTRIFLAKRRAIARVKEHLRLMQSLRQD